MPFATQPAAPFPKAAVAQDKAAAPFTAALAGADISAALLNRTMSLPLQSTPLQSQVRPSTSSSAASAAPTDTAACLGRAAGSPLSPSSPGGAPPPRPPNLYATSIHVLVSACLKLSRATRIPAGRRVFRGLGSMVLGPEWFERDARGARSGVELGFMSTTLREGVALEYSGAGRGTGIVVEFDVGAIDCGARLDSLSQYPGPNRCKSGVNRMLV
jgi:hypothetical protein